MKSLIAVLVVVLSGCASVSDITPLANGQKMSSFTSKKPGDSAADALRKAVQAASQDCGGQIKVLSTSSDGAGPAKFPSGTVIYECQ